METVVAPENARTVEETQNEGPDTENFQKFICELFDKNGILNDIRAYLRGHIVNVLRSAKTGVPHACQKHFTERLELSFQAVNILIAEYLLRFEFSYSMSVFVSEIPLANMVFDFAKTLMQRSDDEQGQVRFTDSDVWCILNYLGVQCDSEHATHLVEMYKNDKQSSLLLCLLKCLPLHHKEDVIPEHAVSDDTLSSAKSSDSQENKRSKGVLGQRNVPHHCRHIKYCKSCQYHMSKVEDKYKKKKRTLIKKISSNTNEIKMDNFMKNVDVLERNLIDEMFEQLKTVYESEVQMIKVEEDKKIKRSIACHTLQLQKEREQLEESFVAREAALRQSVCEKKQFLWGLARGLRRQHAAMATAMRDVRSETLRLSAKEDSLKAQLAEAERILTERGEDMRAQISEELTILEGHLANMKKERDSINEERTKLEKIKALEKNTELQKDNDELHTHYELLKNELGILKKYLETTKLSPKCVIERGTLTEVNDVTSSFNVHLNNQSAKSKSDADDRLKNQVVNDFKKKNVNFRPSNLDEIYRERAHRSSESSEAGDATQTVFEARSDADRDLIQRLQDENDRLKECSRQQSSLLSALSLAACRCPRACVRERDSHTHTLTHSGATPSAGAVSTPTPCQPTYFLRSINPPASSNTLSMGCRKGAGEELSLFSDAQPRIVVPGDDIPFVGVAADRDRRASSRRQLLSQWRSIRNRALPLASASKRTPSPLKEKPVIVAGSSDHPEKVAMTPQATTSAFPGTSRSHSPHSVRNKSQTRHKQTDFETKSNRSKSPKSLLREAKQKLRNIKNTAVEARERSPNAVLREAKMRLRKLEIEAEAVEQSYLDFRRRQSKARVERNQDIGDEPLAMERFKVLDLKRSQSLKKLDSNKSERDLPLTDFQKSMQNDFDKYLREYQTKIDIGQTHFKTQTIADIIKPIPEAYSNMDDENVHHNNYLETPLTEFRKLYQSKKQIEDNERQDISFVTTVASSGSDISHGFMLDKDLTKSPKHDIDKRRKTMKTTEKKMKRKVKLGVQEQSQREESITMEMLKDNMQQMIINSTKTIEIPPDYNKDENLLRVELENATQVQTSDQDVLLIVENTIDFGAGTVSLNSPAHANRQVAIIVSPKGPNEDDLSEKVQRSLSPEQDAHLTRADVLDAIFQGDNDKSNSLLLEIPEIVLKSSAESEAKDDPDDFSADVDNYNSRYESENSISMAKTSDDNFWDS